MATLHDVVQRFNISDIRQLGGDRARATVLGLRRRTIEQPFEAPWRRRIKIRSLTAAIRTRFLLRVATIARRAARQFVVKELRRTTTRLLAKWHSATRFGRKITSVTEQVSRKKFLGSPKQFVATVHVGAHICVASLRNAAAATTIGAACKTKICVLDRRRRRHGATYAEFRNNRVQAHLVCQYANYIKETGRNNIQIEIQKNSAHR